MSRANLSIEAHTVTITVLSKHGPDIEFALYREEVRRSMARGGGNCPDHVMVEELLENIQAAFDSSKYSRCICVQDCTLHGDIFIDIRSENGGDELEAALDMAGDEIDKWKTQHRVNALPLQP